MFSIINKSSRPTAPWSSGPEGAGEELSGIMLAELPTLLSLTAAIGESDAWRARPERQSHEGHG